MQLTFIEPLQSKAANTSPLHSPGIAVTAELLDILARGKQVVVAYSLSGGKDSRGMALNANAFLDTISFAGERVCIHADLDDDKYVIEWKAARESCEEIANYLGLPLITVRRRTGGMITRWHQRWQSNVDRYINLACVRLILPWSTASMRFCTAELKVSPIAQQLCKLFPRKIIISVVGIRAEESTNRSDATIFEMSTHLTKKKQGTTGYTWNAIRDQTLADILQVHHTYNFKLPYTYTQYGLSRLSCAFCILSSQTDIIKASKAEEAAPAYRAITRLEVDSTFSFQTKKWLCDVAPHLLDKDVAERVEDSKAKAKLREAQEKRIPRHLWYTKEGWPTCIPTYDEAALVADVRQQVGDIMDLKVKYTTAQAVYDRYAELYAEKERKAQQKAKKRTRVPTTAGGKKKPKKPTSTHHQRLLLL